MRDPYQSLALPRSATADDIKKSFRLLAKKLHPDTNKDYPKAATLFAEVMTAHDILGDEAKRRAFDRGEIDADGNPAVERAERAVSGLTLSVAGLMVALVLLASTGVVRSLIPSLRDGGEAVSSRVGMDDERDAPPDPRIWSGARLVFPQSVSYVAPDTIPLGIQVSGDTLGLALEISGLPSGATLSRGRPLLGGGWRILASDARHALIHLPSRFSGVIDLAIELRLLDDSVVDRGFLHLAWAQTDPKESTGATASASARAVASAVSTGQDARAPAANSAGDYEPIENLIGRCERLVSNGQVEAARVLLTPAAEARDARAALALGSTYDPIMLAILQGPGVVADIPLALDWYKKAEEFGSSEAEQRLRLLATALKEPRRQVRGPIHVAASRAAAPRVATSRGAAARDAAPDAGERVAAISDSRLRAQLVHDDGRKISVLFGVSY
jgi:DnaJ domain